MLLLLVALVCGCAGPHAPPAASQRRFDFQKDTFAFPNELLWVYRYDTNGNWTTERREPKPTYTLHCLVLARSARQFFLNARFDPCQPVADEQIYRRLIQRVVGSNPRRALPEGEKIVIPGYADLRTFSAAQEHLLKSECGGAWQSYIQRGNWRMIFPFTHDGQEQMADQLLERLRQQPPLVVHVVSFPRLTINHTVVVFDAQETQKEIQFTIYDPNRPAAPATLTFDRSARTFLMTANEYFHGGRVKVYEFYRKWNY